ncbi:MAG: hypothetical protein A2Y38_24370 [Spirochaetes bacterium GWB1_59_5]|nr:MAG: hypothetical protein A2Y38_24370 [Spirochaetes bacterium GWB1_59_5]
MRVSVNHVSILVSDIKKISEKFKTVGCLVGEIERFESEGTEETYIGPSESCSRLLLQAPLKTGPYLAAFKKRGAGLHHIALDVDDLLEFSSFMGRIGWLLHTISLKNYSEHKAVYFARPGVDVLLEVEERNAKCTNDFISRINVPVDYGKEGYIQKLGVPGLYPAENRLFSIIIHDTEWSMKDFM